MPEPKSLVELAAADDVEGLVALEPGGAMTRTRWDEALGEYWDEHEVLPTDADARGPGLLVVTEEGRLWAPR